MTTPEAQSVVCAFGFSDQERRALKSIFSLTTARGHSYSLVYHEDRITGNINLVDADDPQSVEQWRAAHEDAKSVLAVFVTQRPPDAALQLHIARPLTLKKVLDAMETARALTHTGQPMAASRAHNRNHNAFAVLVVDDSLPVRKFMEHKLSGLDVPVQIDFAATGEQALAMTKDGDYDIVFLDVMLPGIDGYKVCKTIKSDRATKSTPVVMLTGKKSPFDKVKGSMSGCDAYLTKPPEEERLNAVIRKYLYHDDHVQLMQGGHA